MLDVLPVIKIAICRIALGLGNELLEGRVLAGGSSVGVLFPQSRTQLLSVSTAAFGSAEMPRFSGFSMSMPLDNSVWQRWVTASVATDCERSVGVALFTRERAFDDDGLLLQPESARAEKTAATNASASGAAKPG